MTVLPTADGNRSASKLLPLFVVTVVLLLAACGQTVAEERDWAAEAEEQMMADGIDADVANCVLSVGRRELERGPLSDAAADELLLNCLAAQDVIDEIEASEQPTPALAMADEPFTIGDDPELDRLWTECEGGLGAACDELFEQSPVGSDYEDFGVSCGARPELLDCSDLDLDGDLDGDLPEEPDQ